MVNIKRDIKVRKCPSRTGNTTDKDSSSIAFYSIFGVGDGNTNITGVMNFDHRNSIFNRDRGYSAVPPF